MNPPNEIPLPQRPSLVQRLKNRFLGLKKASTPDRVSEIAAEVANRGNLRTIQTKLHLQARARWKFRHIEQLAARARLLAFRERPRCHLGLDRGKRMHPPSDYPNVVVDTFSDFDGRGLYFRLESGQIIAAHRSTRDNRPGCPRDLRRNPRLRELATIEIEANAVRPDKPV